MKTDIWIKFYPGDYLRATMDLSIEEHGAYLLLIFYAHTHDGKIPASADRLARILRVKRSQCVRIMERIGDFFEEKSDGFLYNERVNSELAIAKERSEKARKSAESRWSSHADAMQAHMQTQCSGDAIQSQSQNHSQKKEKDKRERATPHALEDRKRSFGESLQEFDFPRELKAEFYEYWTEPNKSKSKMKFEQERTWETSRRLKRWASRESNFKALSSPRGRAVRDTTNFDESVRLLELEQRRIDENG